MMYLYSQKRFLKKINKFFYRSAWYVGPVMLFLNSTFFTHVMAKIIIVYIHLFSFFWEKNFSILAINFVYFCNIAIEINFFSISLKQHWTNLVIWRVTRTKENDFRAVSFYFYKEPYENDQGFRVGATQFSSVYFFCSVREILFTLFIVQNT